MNYVIFDDKLIENFFPITLTRSTGDLRVGILKLRQRIAAFLETDNTHLLIPGRLSKLYKERHPDKQINIMPEGDTVLINSRLKIDDDWVEKIRSLPSGTCIVEDETILIARLHTKEEMLSAEDVETLCRNLKKSEVSSNVSWKFLWELIADCAEYIKRDFTEFFYDKDNFFETEQGVTVLNPYNVWFGEGCEFKPGVVIDASNGPVVIDENVRIMPNAVIIGPAYLGKKTLIKVSAKIYEGTSIGPVCKIGGEIESSIFQGYSNKQHDGFLGHAYLGEWVNLGADTNNSDLKNNYKTVKSYFYPLKETVDTKNRFLGAVIGDHSKTGINCSINTGTVIGAGCNLYGSYLLSGFIPSFSWGTGSDTVPYKPESFLETARIVKQRRGLDATPSDEELFNEIRSIDPFTVK